MDPLQAARRRQQVAQLVYNVLTDQGRHVAGVADMIADGRVDVLGHYLVGDNHDDDEMEPATMDCVDELSYDNFVDKYMQLNRPVLIRGLTDNWKARSVWTSSDGREPNVQAMATEYGGDVVSVAEQVAPGFTLERPRICNMTLADYARWWQSHSSDTRRLLYLKDYKFTAAHVHDEIYEWPTLFKDDWLNADMNAYRFVYLGPKGTSTLLHADVLRSYSWSSNVVGCKQWWLVPPAATHLLYHVFGQHLATHLHADEGAAAVWYPGLARARALAVCIQQDAGETLFVPSHWYHSVENLAPTLSINHNWINAYNIAGSWEHCQRELNAAGGRTSLGANDNSQIADDVVLLAHIIANKVSKIVMNEKELDDKARRDLQVAGPILVAIVDEPECQALLNNGLLDGARIQALIDDIRKRLAL